jgi:response regulator RpfG family c-di-GMP phosphodiesterase
MVDVEENKLKLMVVDDEADNLELLHRTFRRDFEVFLAESGVKALQVLEQEGEMAIIISDQRMPKMNGTEFLSRTVDRFPDTMRILLTGYTDVEDLVGAINAGKVFKYIMKPWNPDDLTVVVQQAAETYRVLKQRTNELHRALRRESLFNTVTTAIRESLDYRSMLQTVVETIGHTFNTDTCILRPVLRCLSLPQGFRAKRHPSLSSLPGNLKTRMGARNSPDSADSN